MNGPCALLLAALAGSVLPGEPPGQQLGRDGPRSERFEELLRTYPERRPEVSLEIAARLVDEGEFPGRDRAEYWIGSARLSLGDRDGARAWFGRLARDYPESAWTERSQLGLADAAAQEGHYGEALARSRRAASAKDPAVREIARLQTGQLRILRARQRWAWGAAAFAAAVALWLAGSLLRRRPVSLWPLPGELRIAGPVLAVLALASLGQDAAPRAAVLEVACGGALVVGLSGLRLRAVPLRATGRALHLAATLGALLAIAYVAIYRADLVGMVQETLRAGPD